jgi:hypothetical protein
VRDVATIAQPLQTSVIDELDASLSDLAMQIEELSNRLTPVLQPDHDTVGGSTPVPVQSRVRELLAGFTYQTGRINALIQRLEV